MCAGAEESPLLSIDKNSTCRFLFFFHSGDKLARMSDNINHLFGSTFECSCGKTHKIDPRRILYARGVLSQLPDVCAAYCSGRNVAVLMDIRTREVAGAEAVEQLGRTGWSVQEIVVPDLPGGKSPVCDDITKNALAKVLSPSDMVVSVGAGVINDLGKWLAFERGVPFITIATASSMNGYTSANVAPTVGGVKTLVRAQPPTAVLADPDILRDAPYEMTASGLGDVLAKSVSSADWYMNHLLFGDFYCERSVGLIAKIEPLYLENPGEMLARSDGAMEALFQALLMTGAAMTMAESSAPSSGGEHMVSHTLDMMSSVDSEPHDLHGRQVGVGTVLTSELYRRVLAIDRPTFVAPPAGVDRAFWGFLADNVAAEYAKKASRLTLAAEKLSQAGAWDHLRRSVSPMLRRPETIRDCLKHAGAACTARQLGLGRERLLAALAHAHEIRSRFTILDLACLTGVLPGALEELVNNWA